jgi:hypothetical protein
MNKFLLSLFTLALLSVSALPAMAKHYTPAQCPVVGNTTSKVYHTSTSAHYAKMLDENVGTDNRQCFQTVAAAERAGFKKTAVGVAAAKTEKKVVKAATTTKRVVKEDVQKVASGTKKVAKKVSEKSVEVKDTVVKDTKKVGTSTKKITKKVVEKTEKTVDKMGTKKTPSTKKKSSTKKTAE